MTVKRCKGEKKYKPTRKKTNVMKKKIVPEVESDGSIVKDQTIEI